MLEEKTFLLHFDKNHYDRKNFSCSNTEINAYYKNTLSQDIRRYLNAGYFFCNQNKKIIGFFTLSQYSMENNQLDKKEGSRENIPATLLGYFAISKAIERSGFGKKMMLEVFKKHIEISKDIGSASLILETLPSARKFYENIGIFKKFETNEVEKNDWLFAKTKEIQKLLNNLGSVEQ